MKSVADLRVIGDGEKRRIRLAATRGPMACPMLAVMGRNKENALLVPGFLSRLASWQLGFSRCCNPAIIANDKQHSPHNESQFR